MSGESKRTTWGKVVQLATLLTLAVTCLLVWTRVLSFPAFADPQDVDIRELSESRSQELKQQHGTLCIEIVHSTPDGILLSTGTSSSDPLPSEVLALASEHGIADARVGDTFANSERLLVASNAVPRAVPDRGTSIVFEAVELQRFSGGAKGTTRWEVVHTEVMYPCDQQRNPVPLVR